MGVKPARTGAPPHPLAAHLVRAGLIEPPTPAKIDYLHEDHVVKPINEGLASVQARIAKMIPDSTGAQVFIGQT